MVLFKNIRPWFGQHLIDIVKLMVSDELKEISQEKADLLIKTINLYMLPFDQNKQQLLEQTITTDENKQQTPIFMKIKEIYSRVLQKFQQKQQQEQQQEEQQKLVGILSGQENFSHEQLTAELDKLSLPNNTYGFGLKRKLPLLAKNNEPELTSSPNKKRKKNMPFLDPTEFYKVWQHLQ